MTDFKTRFAPSPTGALHIGHAYSALVAFRAARSVGGTFQLRIEDIDRGRCRPEYEQQIFDDLRWLGIDWDGPVVRQSDRLDIYERALTRLIDRKIVYRCFKSRSQINQEIAAPHGRPETVYRGAPLSNDEEQEALAAGKAFSWRLSLDAVETLVSDQSLFWTEEVDGVRKQRSADFSLFGDVILARKDIDTSYHLASVIDDAEAGVSHVIRGEDLRDVAGLHRLLQFLLGYAPPIYRHHRLILDDQGERLAKRADSVSIRTLREQGANQKDILTMIGLSPD